ncbi:MAG: acyl carrier protein [Anaerotignum sp.]|nr:acyl carrier protein [Anaerotignum sp.]
MLEKIIEILSQYTEEEITEESILVNDLGLTSFDLVSLVTEFEDEFDVEIADREIRKLVSVADIMEYIENYQ